MLSQTEIYLAKSKKIIVPKYDGRGKVPVQFLGSAIKNIQSLGFGFGEETLAALSDCSEHQIMDFYEEILPILKKMVGAHKRWKAFYPNFPEQVAEASDAELYYNAMMHYYSAFLSDLFNDPTFVFLPEYEEKDRPSLDEYHELRWINFGSEEDFNQIFTNLIGANSSISDEDKEIVSWFIENRDIQELLPESIPQKEILAYLVGNLPDPEVMSSYLKTATDILRVAVALSGGDVSLAEPTKFISFSRKQRRFLLSSLDNLNPSNAIEDMLRWPERWKRLGERLHAGEYQNRFPNAFQAFDVIRNDLPFRTYNSLVEESILARDSEQTVGLLSQRPGEFTRRLDRVLRTHNDIDVVVESYLACADKVSTPVLLQARAHFMGRMASGIRSFMPKGSLAKMQVIDNKLPELDPVVCENVSEGIRGILEKRFSNSPSLGKVYLSEELRNQTVPFSQRSASRALNTVSRGSNFALPEGNTVRFFIWWKNLGKEYAGHRRVDIDLSAIFIHDDWSVGDNVSYTNLRSGNAYHSGDITDAPKGACEFIDINLPCCSPKEQKAGKKRYVAMCVYSYSSQPFIELPECFAGWMMREQPKSGEIFEPKTVKNKIDLTANTKVCIPLIIDTYEKRVYWTDLALNNLNRIHNTHSTSTSVSQMVQAFIEMKKPDLYDLFSMHVAGRPDTVLVDNPAEADTVFDLDDATVSPYDTDVIMKEYLA